MLMSPSVGSSIEVTKVPPPDRNGDASGNGDNVSCPPGPDHSTKGDPDPALGDKDVTGDGSVDFFMGEWHFVDGNQDLKVRSWCVNRTGGATTFGDFFTYEILTSMDGVDTVAVGAGVPT